MHCLSKKRASQPRCIQNTQQGLSGGIVSPVTVPLPHHCDPTSIAGDHKGGSGCIEGSRENARVHLITTNGAGKRTADKCDVCALVVRDCKTDAAAGVTVYHGLRYSDIPAGSLIMQQTYSPVPLSGSIVKHRFTTTR